jgi:hypothetical protein
MKKLMIMGALIGFSSGLLLGTFQGASWPDALWRASITCFVASYLFRWWGRMWLNALRQANEQRLDLASPNSVPPANV